MINNKGNLGAALKETFSADSLKGAAIAGVTAGVLNYADANWFSAASQGPKAANLLTSTNFTDVAIRTGGRAVLSSGISTAIGGGSFGDNLGAALMGEAGNVAMATGFNWVGDTVKFPDGGFQKVVAHALMGGFLSKAMGGDFATGAAAAGLNEAMVNQLASIANGNEELHKMFSQLTGVLVAAAGNGDLQLGADIAGNATQYNHNLHEGAAREVAAEALGHCQSNPNECDLGVDFSGLSVEDVVKAMRVEGEHGEGIEGVKPEAIAFIDGYMFSRVPRLRDDLYSLTESEASRLDMEQKATLAMSAFSLGQSVRSIGNFLQGLIGLGESTAILVKNADEAALAGAKATGTVIDTAPMAQRVMDVRAGLPSNLKRSGNVAVAEIDIPGIPKQMAAHSQVSDAGKGLIGSGSGNFVAQSVPNKAGDMVYRGIDTEYKILDNIADQLGSNTSARGTVNILTEKAACASCLNVAEQFKAKYPNITVNILDNQGVMLRPPRKMP